MNKPLTGTLITLLGVALSQAACAMTQVQVHAPRPDAIAANTGFGAVRGTYVLPNGQALNLSGRAQHPVAQLGDRPEVALVAQSPTRYEAVDGSLRLEFTPHANGLVSSVSVTYTP